MHGRAHGDNVEHVGDYDFGAHVMQRVGARIPLAHHGAYAMAFFQQDGDGPAGGRADGAGGASDENGFLGHDFLLHLSCAHR